MLQAIKDAAAKVAEQAEHVNINDRALSSYAQLLSKEGGEAPSYDRVHHFLGSPEDTLAYIFTLDAVNFGSGYFPYLRKRAGMSGYFTVASCLKDKFEKHGAFSARDLLSLTPKACAELFEQPLANAVQTELMELFATALNDLGDWLESHQSFVNVIEAANQSAEKLAELLTEMPFFQDVSPYQGFDVPLYKRAQITPSDIALAFNNEGYGRFDDLDKLTIFADNLVPHVLRVDGLLVYSLELADNLANGDLLAPSSAKEVEIRAVSVHVVEQLAKLSNLPARQLDILLWNRGQEKRYRSAERHRTRTVFY